MRRTEMLGGAGALLRLFVRWYSLGLVFIVALTAMTPSFFLGDDGLLLLVGQSLPDGRDTDAPMRQLVLHMGMLLPLMFAFCTSVATGELYGTSVSWSLPHLGRKLFAGHLVVLTLVTTAIGVFALFRTDRTTALYVMALVSFWYGLAVSDPPFAPRRWTVVGVVLAAIVLAIKPAWYASALTPSPIVHVLVVLAMVSGIVMLAQRHRTTRIRNSVLLHRATRMLQAAGGYSATTLGAIDVQQPHSTPRRNLSSWIQAAMTESSQTRRRWFRSYVLGLAFMAAFTYLCGTFVGIIGMTVVGGGLQLSGAFTYPLSRKQRAMLRYACSAVEVAMLGLVVGLTYGLLARLDVPRTLFTDAVIPFDWRVELAALCVMLPIAQWPRAIRRLSLQSWQSKASWQKGFILPAGLLMIGTALFPRLLMKALGEGATTAALAYLGLALIVVQGMYYTALRVAYARRDL